MWVHITVFKGKGLSASVQMGLFLPLTSSSSRTNLPELTGIRKGGESKQKIPHRIFLARLVGQRLMTSQSVWTRKIFDEYLIVRFQAGNKHPFIV